MTFSLKRCLSAFVFVLMLFSVSGCIKGLFTHTITFDTNGGEAVTPLKYKTGASVTLPNPVKDGWYFGGWFTDERLTVSFSETVMPPRNLTLFAKWVEDDPLEIIRTSEEVALAEESLLPADFDLAHTSVELLRNEDIRTELHARLDAITPVIDQIRAASEMVLRAEASKAPADVEEARKAVLLLPQCRAKDNLLTRLDSAFFVASATQAVALAEETRRQVNVDVARDLVCSLPDGPVKNELLSRLIVAQRDVDANNYMISAVRAVSKAELSGDQSDIDNAYTLVEGLPDGMEKNMLIARVDKVQHEADVAIMVSQAIQAVETAEAAKTQSSLDEALFFVNVLPSGNAKESLMARIQILQELISSRNQP